MPLKAANKIRSLNIMIPPHPIFPLIFFLGGGGITIC